MNSNSKRSVISAVAIALVLICIALAVVWSTRQKKANNKRDDTKNVLEVNSDHSPIEKASSLNSETRSLVKIASANPADSQPVVSSSDPKFWNSVSPDGSKTIEINNQTAKFELSEKSNGRKVSFSNWQKVDGVDYEIVKWTWKDDDTLVGPGWSDLDGDDQRRDVGDVKLFIYQCGVSKEPEPVSGPSLRPNMCIRLEGFNNKGEILLAEVFLDGYKRYGRMADGERLLGAFDLLPRTK